MHCLSPTEVEQRVNDPFRQFVTRMQIKWGMVKSPPPRDHIRTRISSLVGIFGEHVALP